uniref:Putative D27 protein n=1 Tax=Chlorokybus atmophyticus TaxID=3144 RepID=I6PI00_CHLAT|nr:putative D27 protein [Chlorokybus atmophyticus]
MRQAYGNVAGWQSPRSFKEGYLGMVEVSHSLMRNKAAKQQHEAVLQGFPKVPEWFRKVFAYTKWGAELNAWVTPTFFKWLVGPMEVRDVDINGVTQRSQVHIKKCRYLETSGCVGMCVNLCKFPTQKFFTEEMGMPLTMKPNFDDLSCEMIFGQVPPPIEEDEARAQPCFATCPTARTVAPNCPKLA